MLIRHMEAVERQLLAISKIPANAGHSLHKGTPREAFIREFLEKHINSTVEIGSGEIIDSNSSPTEQRNQFDIVVFKRNYPRLNFGGGVNAFLAESVLATIEVKSTLDESDVQQAAKAARVAKGLTRNVVKSFSSGYMPPAIVSYVVAYDGPANISTVHGWIKKSYLKLGFSDPVFSPNIDRSNVAGPAIDGIYVLGKGFCNFGNTPYGFLRPDTLVQHPKVCWEIADIPFGALLALFLNLTVVTSSIEGAWLNPLPYLRQFNVPKLTFGE